MTREGGNWARMDVEEESYFNGSDEDDDASGAPKAGSRKREAEASTEDRKRLRLDQAPSSLPRSKTWPEGATDSKGKGKGLVDYGDEDSDDEDVTPGGFIRAAEAPPALGGSDTGPVSTASESTLETETPAPEPPAEDPAPGPLIDTGDGPPPVPPRRKEADDDDQLGLLSAKRKLAAKPSIGAAKAGAVTSKFKVSFGVKNLASLAGGAGSPAKDAEGGK